MTNDAGGRNEIAATETKASSARAKSRFSKLINSSMLVLMVLNGLFFICNIYVLGNTKAAIKMHKDLAPNAGAFIANAKVLAIFITGILYLLAAYGIVRRKRSLAFAGVIGFLLSDGFYVVQLFLWASIRPRIWIHFGTIGGFSLLIGVYSWLNSGTRMDS